ncbi:MAG: TRAP-type C4-dicarboxylate transporter component [Candidatus Frackibacter sp. T328-2]|nr:MAG: TRAP-type C4-dicarboxylate transporter component [Candidatus Frackibacter sp. T328-2]
MSISGKKLGVILVSLMLVFSVIISGCSGGADKQAKSDQKAKAPEYTVKFALEEIEGSVQHAWAKEFKKRLEKKSNGKIKVKIYPYGSLGSSEDITELVQNGVIQFAFASPGHLASFIPEVGMFSLHYIWPNNMKVNKEVMASSEAIYGMLAKKYAENNLKLLEVNHEGWQVWSANKPIRSPKDMQGLKIRVMGDPILIKNYKAYGANPVQLAYSEIYSALQLNMIDANIQPMFAHQEMKFYEQQDYLISAKQVPFITTVVANEGFFKSLPKEYQKMITETSHELVDYIFEVQKELNNKRVKKMKEAKPSLKVINLNEKERMKFKARAKTVWQSYKKDVGEDGAKILNKLLKEIKAAKKQYN